MNARVLVVDDDPSICRSLAMALGRAGYLVTTAADVTPALALVDTFDVVVADFHMKTGTGADVVRHYKSKYGRQIYCVVLSGEDDESTRSYCHEAGADVILLKPTLLHELRRCLSTGLEAMRAA